MQMPAGDLKCLLEVQLGVPVTRQRLIFRGRVLRDDVALADAGADSTAHHLLWHLPSRHADNDEQMNGLTPPG